MNILLITNDWKPKKGGITTYLSNLSENSKNNIFVYGPNWIAGENTFKSTENFSFDEARLEFTEDEFTDDEIRLLRIDFISQVAN